MICRPRRDDHHHAGEALVNGGADRDCRSRRTEVYDRGRAAIKA